MNLKGYTKTMWKTNDGRRIRVKNMDNQHLVNTIKFLRRHAVGWILKDLGRMGNYIEDAPDGAAMACETEADRLASMSDDEYLSDKVPTFDALLKEAEKRGLQL